MSFYVSFGSGHRRRLDRIEITQHGVVQVEADDADVARDLAVSVFGQRWSMLYAADSMVWSEHGFEYWPFGVTAVLRIDADGFPALHLPPD